MKLVLWKSIILWILFHFFISSSKVTVHPFQKLEIGVWELHFLQNGSVIKVIPKSLLILSSFRMLTGLTSLSVYFMFWLKVKAVLNEILHTKLFEKAPECLTLIKMSPKSGILLGWGKLTTIFPLESFANNVGRSSISASFCLDSSNKLSCFSVICLKIVSKLYDSQWLIGNILIEKYYLFGW